MARIVIKKLIWDEWNIRHIAHHHVLPGEVVEVFRGIYSSYASYDGRFVVIGATAQKRILLIVLDPEPGEGEYYIVTAHTASKKDQILFQKEKGGDTHDTTKK